MSTTGRQDPDVAAISDVAERLRTSAFVHVACVGDGSAVASTGLIVRTLARLAIPFQVSPVAPHDSVARDTGADTSITIGFSRRDSDVEIGVGKQASRHALEIVRELGRMEGFSLSSDDVELALAGVLATGGRPDDDLLDLAAQVGIERRPGVALPTDDVVDGIALSTAFHAPFSGSIDETERALAGILPVEPGNEQSWRDLGSAVALSVAGDEDATPAGVAHVETALRPHDADRFETVGGFAAVLDASAQERFGLAYELATGRGDDEEALACWRDHATRTHGCIHAAETSRFDGLFVVHCPEDAPLRTVARLVAIYRSPEPVVLAVTDGAAVARRTPESDVDVVERLATAAEAVDGRAGGTPQYGTAKFDVESAEFVDAVEGRR